MGGELVWTLGRPHIVKLLNPMLGSTSSISVADHEGALKHPDIQVASVALGCPLELYARILLQKTAHALFPRHKYWARN